MTFTTIELHEEAEVFACLEGSLAADERAPYRVRSALNAFAEKAGAPAELRDRLALVVTEAVTNVVVHAYPSGRRGLVHYAADVSGADVQVVIVDDGAGMRSGENPDRPGFGLQIVAAASDDFAITARRRGLELWMRLLR
jgi:anti-sigma regulatory factor (Ser/Thr protein kinase)